jgi:hypothetical protein
MNKSEREFDEQMRTETQCRGCGEPKDIGLVVCWICFKYRTDIPVTLKYYQGTLKQWFKEIGAPRPVVTTSL